MIQYNDPTFKHCSTAQRGYIYQCKAVADDDPVTALLGVEGMVSECVHPVDHLHAGSLGPWSNLCHCVGATQSVPSLAPPSQELMRDVRGEYASLSQLDAALSGKQYERNKHEVEPFLCLNCLPHRSPLCTYAVCACVL